MGKKVWLAVAGGVLLIGVIANATSGNKGSGSAAATAAGSGQPRSSSAPADPATQASLAPTAAPRPVDQFPTLTAVLKGNTNVSKLPRLKAFEWRPDSGTVYLDLNANDNLTTGLTRDGIKTDMSDSYIALFHGTGPTVQMAQITAWMVLTDKFGTSRNVAVVATKLDKATADRINWGADKALLELRILPGLWTTVNSLPVVQWDAK